MSYRHLMCRKKPVMFQNCGEPLIVKYSSTSLSTVETRKSLEMSDNLFEPLSTGVPKVCAAMSLQGCCRSTEEFYDQKINFKTQLWQ